MNIGLKSLVAAGLVAGALGLGANGAQAMPIGAPPAISLDGDALRAENVRWVCGPYGCRWVPNFYAYGPRPHWRPRHHWGHRYGGRRW